jgi:colanic acid/amylovoran biosynthesis glycosyltransferase
MPRIAYLANQFPSPVEPYVVEEIEELRRRGVHVVSGTVRRPESREMTVNNGGDPEVVVLRPLRMFMLLLQAPWLCLSRWRQIADLMKRVVFRGRETLWQRVKALSHTWLGANYALLLQEHNVEHIHVHHGYFGSWIAMVAAQLLDVSFSMTLHGSDLLVRSLYLDTKLETCRFCLTVSEYNRQHILEHYPAVEAGRVVVRRLGVDLVEHLPASCPAFQPTVYRTRSDFNLLAVGRLHPVKDHAFLVRACAQILAGGVRFECSIAGEGPERRSLESLIRKCGLQEQVTLLGHVTREQVDSLYQRADLIVLTSRSEGIPLVLMEAMARGKIVLAPAITGIPELVIAGQTGFLYEPGSLGDFVAKLLFIQSLMRERERGNDRARILSAAKPLDWVRHGARVQVRHNFNRKNNLVSFADLFLRRTGPQMGSVPGENSLLQQVQLSFQRD